MFCRQLLTINFQPEVLWPFAEASSRSTAVHGSLPNAHRPWDQRRTQRRSQPSEKQTPSANFAISLPYPLEEKQNTSQWFFLVRYPEIFVGGAEISQKKSPFSTTFASQGTWTHRTPPLPLAPGRSVKVWQSIMGRFKTLLGALKGCDLKPGSLCFGIWNNPPIWFQKKFRKNEKVSRKSTKTSI